MSAIQAYADIYPNTTLITTFSRWHHVKKNAIILGWCDEDWDEIVELSHERSKTSLEYCSLDFIEMGLKAYLAGCSIPGIMNSIRNPEVNPGLDF